MTQVNKGLAMSIASVSLLGMIVAPASGADRLLVGGGLSHSVVALNAGDGSNATVYIAPGAGGISDPRGSALGPDGRRYVASFGTDEVLRFDPVTGAFLDVFVPAAQGLVGPTDVAFAHDGSLLVTSRGTDEVLRFDAATGAPLGGLVSDDPSTAGIDETGGLSAPEAMAHGPDGHLYVVSNGNDAVLRYHGETGQFVGAFVPSGSGGLDDPRGLAFGPLSGLFVSSAANDRILRYDSVTGVFTGVFATSGSGGLDEPHGLAFGPDRHLYVASTATDQVLRYHGNTGAALGVFGPTAPAGIDGPRCISFDPAPRSKLLAPAPGDIGLPSTLSAFGLDPNAPLALIVGTHAGELVIPGCGVGFPLNITDGLLAAVVFADPQGSLQLPVVVPAIASGVPLLLQALEPVACRSSNVARFTAGDTGSEAFFSIDPYGNMESSSTYNVNCFSVTNQSGGGQLIVQVTIDLSTAVFPDMVYDPFGAAGDIVGKNLQVDTDPGVGFTGHAFAALHDLGYDRVSLDFTGFAPGNTFSFSIDVDPTTIQGSSSPGPSHSGSINGLELMGSTVTIVFSDGTVKSRRLFRIPGSTKGSRVTLDAGASSAPTLEVVGVPTTPALVGAASQTVRVHGNVGETVTVVVIEAGLYLAGLPGGGFDIDPFEANKAIAVTEKNVVIGTSGVADVPITLTKSEAEAGLNYIAAAHKDVNGNTGALSNVVILQLP